MWAFLPNRRGLSDKSLLSPELRLRRTWNTERQQGRGQVKNPMVTCAVMRGEFSLPLMFSVKNISICTGIWSICARFFTMTTWSFQRTVVKEELQRRKEIAKGNSDEEEKKIGMTNSSMSNTSDGRNSA